MKPLFELTTDILALDALENELGGELTPEIQTAWESMARELYEDEAAKADVHIHWIRRLESEAAAARAEAEQYTRHAITRENRVKRIKELWKQHLEATARTKVTTATNRVIAIQQNGGVQKLTIAPGIKADDVPAEFRRVIVEFNNEAIREALEGPDALVWAKLEPRGTSLRIR
jgi:hypothetical protein